MVNVQQPLAGLDRAWAYQSQPPFSMSDCSNVRLRDVFEKRNRLGSRPGLVKAFTQHLGDAAPVVSYTQDVFPIKDTYLYLATPDTARDAGNNNSSHLVGSWAGTNIARTIIHFDLSTIPAGPTVTLATLSLYRSNRNGADTAVAMKLARILDADEGWSETQATWNSRATGTPWSVANDESPQVGPYTLTTPAAVNWNTPTVNGFFSITGLAAMVQYALDNRSEQLHILLMAADEVAGDVFDGNIIFLRSSEYTPDPTQQPKLTVTYEV